MKSPSSRQPSKRFAKGKSPRGYPLPRRTGNFVFVCLLSLMGAGAASPTDRQVWNANHQKLAALVQEFRVLLNIEEQISVSIVRKNHMLASVRPSSKQPGSFVVRFDRSFLAALADEELRAAIAHELGHVWIFVHQPYVQSEPLANKKALEVIQLDSLQKMYEKVRAYQGRHGRPGKVLDGEKALATTPPASDSWRATERR